MKKVLEIKELQDGMLRFEVTKDTDELGEALYALGCQSEECFSAVVGAALYLLSDFSDAQLTEMAREFRKEHRSINVS